MDSDKPLDKITPKMKDAAPRHPPEGEKTAGQPINPQKRVIKQIVSLDSKKFKELGIESNILSAMSKFSGE